MAHPDNHGACRMPVRSSRRLAGDGPAIHAQHDGVRYYAPAVIGMVTSCYGPIANINDHGIVVEWGYCRTLGFPVAVPWHEMLRHYPEILAKADEVPF